MAADEADRYVHEALFYSSAQGLVDAAAPFLRDGFAVGDDVVLICTDENNRAVAEALGDDDRIIYLPRPEVYQEALTAVMYYRDFMRGRLRSGSRQVRLVGQADFGTDSRSWDEWRRFEALCNHALSPFPLWSLCAYDTETLPDTVIATGELGHPYIRRGGTRGSNPAYVDPAELMGLPGNDLEPLPDIEPAMTIAEASDLRSFHHQLRELLQSERVTSEKVDDLVLSVNEVVTNGIRHGLPPVTVSVWLSASRIVCTVSDHGPGFDDPFLGYLPGGEDTLPEGQFGLWLARRLCDDLVTSRTPEGFTVRLVMNR